MPLDVIKNKISAKKLTAIKSIINLIQKSNNSNSIKNHNFIYINKQKNKNKKIFILKCPLKFQVIKSLNSNFSIFCSIEKTKKKSNDKSNLSFEDSDENDETNIGKFIKKKNEHFFLIFF